MNPRQNLLSLYRRRGFEATPVVEQGPIPVQQTLFPEMASDPPPRPVQDEQPEGTESPQSVSDSGSATLFP